MPQSPVAMATMPMAAAAGGMPNALSGMVLVPGAMPQGAPVAMGAQQAVQTSAGLMMAQLGGLAPLAGGAVVTPQGVALAHNMSAGMTVSGQAMGAAGGRGLPGLGGIPAGMVVGTAGMANGYLDSSMAASGAEGMRYDGQDMGVYQVASGAMRVSGRTSRGTEDGEGVAWRRTRKW